MHTHLFFWIMAKSLSLSPYCSPLMSQLRHLNLRSFSNTSLSVNAQVQHKRLLPVLFLTQSSDTWDDLTSLLLNDYFHHSIYSIYSSDIKLRINSILSSCHYFNDLIVHTYLQSVHNQFHNNTCKSQNFATQPKIILHQ